MSIFDNFCNEKDDKNIKNAVEILEDKPHSFWQEAEERVKHIKKEVLPWAKKSIKASAEIESSLKVIEEIRKRNDEEIEIVLLATDTILSRLAAEIIKEVLDKKNIEVLDEKNINVTFNPDKDVIHNLQLKNKKSFEEEGLMNLIERVTEICEIYSDGGRQTCAEPKVRAYLNITGGYKALVPYLTVIGQIYELPIYYKFEDKEEIINIPQLPIEYDFLLIDDNYAIIEKLNYQKEEKLPSIEKLKEDVGATDDKSFEDRISYLENKKIIQKITTSDNETKYKLTPIGKMLFIRHNRFAEQGIPRNNIIGEVMELKVYEYYVNEYSKRDNKASITRNYEVSNLNDKNNPYDIDVFIQSEGKKIAVEVKTNLNKSNIKKEIKEKILEKGFYQLAKQCYESNEDIEFYVVTCSPDGVSKAIIDEIKKINEGIKNHDEEFIKNMKLSWHWFRRDRNNIKKTLSYQGKIYP